MHTDMVVSESVCLGLSRAGWLAWAGAATVGGGGLELAAASSFSRPFPLPLYLASLLHQSSPLHLPRINTFGVVIG